MARCWSAGCSRMHMHLHASGWSAHRTHPAMQLPETPRRRCSRRVQASTSSSTSETDTQLDARAKYGAVRARRIACAARSERMHLPEQFEVETRTAECCIRAERAFDQRLDLAAALKQSVAAPGVVDHAEAGARMHVGTHVVANAKRRTADAQRLDVVAAAVTVRPELGECPGARELEHEARPERR